MNAKFLSAALIAAAGFAAAPAFAGTSMANEVGDISALTSDTSTLSRAEVRNDYLQARRDGTLQAANEVGQFQAAAPAADATLTRAQVRSQAVYAVQHGLRIPGEV